MDLRFDCFFYHVSDMDRAVSFYRDLLGLQLKSRDVVARFEIDGVLFELVPDSPQRGGGGKLCLRTEDLSRTAEELRERGVAVSDPRT
ncbi:MAG: VOC family protein, partial [Bacteroidota bacterium]